MTTDKSRADALTDLQIMEALEAAGVKWQEQRSLANDREILTYGSTPAADIIAGIRVLLAASPVGQPAAAPIQPEPRTAGEAVYRFGDDGVCRIQSAPSPADERSAFETLKGAWQSMPPFDVFCAGWRAARAASANETGMDERAAKKPDVMTKAVKQLADWLLTDPNEGNPLCFAGPPEPFVLGLSRVKMRSIAGDEWTLIAGLQEGWLTAEQRASNFWRIAKLEREEVAREEAVAQYKEIRARAASADETGAEGANALAHEVWSAAQRAPGEGIEDAVQRIAAILSRSPAMGAEAVAMPVGWKLVRVNGHFDALIAALERAESKGYLPDAVREEWENFACDENVAAPQPPAQAAMPVLTNAMRAVITNESGAYQSADDLYAALCAAAGDERPAQADARVGLTADDLRELRGMTSDPRLFEAEREAIRKAVALLQGANHG